MALPSVSRSLEQPLDSHAACATGTVVVLDAARRQKARVVYAGSSSAYGNQEAQWKQEAMREDPLSPYAAATGSSPVSSSPRNDQSRRSSHR